MFTAFGFRPVLDAEQLAAHAADPKMWAAQEQPSSPLPDSILPSPWEGGGADSSVPSQSPHDEGGDGVDALIPSPAEYHALFIALPQQAPAADRNAAAGLARCLGLLGVAISSQAQRAGGGLPVVLPAAGWVQLRMDGAQALAVSYSALAPNQRTCSL
jgi:hypothetical protein